jgi:hypothetical protein
MPRSRTKEIIDVCRRVWREVIEHMDVPAKINDLGRDMAALDVGGMGARGKNF